MGDIIKRKLILGCIALAVLFLSTAIGFSILIVTCLQKEHSLEFLRIDMNNLVSELESSEISDYEALFSNYDKKFAVLGIDGKIIFSNKDEFTTGSSVSLHSLSIGRSDSYRIPLLKNDVQFATLVADYDGADYQSDATIFFLSALPIFLFVVALAIGFYVCHVMKCDVFAPAEEIRRVTNKIIDGDMSAPLTYDYDGAIGNLCHDFEIMREQLSQSIERERKLKEDERVLLASISHDIKTPLSIVIGFTDGILLGVVTEHDDIIRYAQRIKERAVALNSLTDDILENTKAELYQLSIVKEEVYSKKYFSSVVDDLLAVARQKGFETVCSEIPNVLMLLDKKRTSQVLHNIIGNSIKYGNEGGKIEVTFSLCDGNFTVSVIDNGKGIAAADLPFIFDKFYRGDKSRTQNIPGSGLGLSISKYIIEQQGGRIECDSILDVGTQMSFSLPY